MRVTFRMYVAVALGLAVGIAIVLWWLPTIVLLPSAHRPDRG